MDRLAVAQDKLTASLELLPAILLEPFVEPKLRHFHSRKRAMTGREAAEDQERDRIKQRQRAAIQAQTDHVGITAIVHEYQYVYSVSTRISTKLYINRGTHVPLS